MSGSITSTKRSLQLVSETQLLDFEFRPFQVDGHLHFILRVFRFRTEIFRTGIGVFTQLGLETSISRLSLKYRDEPHGVKYALTVFSMLGGNKIQTTVDITPVLKVQFEKSSGTLLVRAISPAVPSQLIQLVAKSVAQYRKKTTLRSVKGLQVVKTSRSSPQTSNVTVNTYNRAFNGSVVNTPSQRTRAYRTFSSVRTPGYKAKAKAGTLPVNAYSMYKVEVVNGSFSQVYDIVYKPTGQVSHSENSRNYSPYLLYTDILASHLSVDENLVISRLSNRITKSNSTNLGEDAATIVQTLRLFTNSVNRLTSLAKALRNGNLTTYFRAIGQPQSKAFIRSYNAATRNGIVGANLLATMWLEYRYGWLPLLNSVSATMGAYSQYLESKPVVVSVHQSAKSRTTNRTAISGINNIAVPPNIVGWKTFEKETKCRIGLSYTVSDPLVAMFAQLGLTSPASLLWELTPWSFAVDWFLGIGNALQAGSAFDGLVFKRGYKTYFTRERAYVGMGWQAANEDVAYRRKESITGQCQGEGVRMNRTVLTDFPSPKLPSLKNPVSLIHAANATALLVVALTSKQIGRKTTRNVTARKPKRPNFAKNKWIPNYTE